MNIQTTCPEDGKVTVPASVVQLWLEPDVAEEERHGCYWFTCLKCHRRVIKDVDAHVIGLLAEAGVQPISVPYDCPWDGFVLIPHCPSHSCPWVSCSNNICRMTFAPTLGAWLAPWEEDDEGEMA